VPAPTEEQAPLPPYPALPGLRRLAVFPPFWQLQLIGWITLAVATFPLKTVAFGSVSFALVISLVREPLGLFLSAGLRSTYRRLGLDPARPVRLVVATVIASYLCAAFDVAIGACIGLALGRQDDLTFHLGILNIRAALFGVWSFLYFWIKAILVARAHELALARARVEAREAELQLLRAQVDPHFLFNALNTLLALVPGNARADSAIRNLSAYLRYSLAHRADEFVPLSAEFEATSAYLAVEQARFREDLILELQLDEGARNLPVPGVLLQPLVENAVKHGRETTEPPHRVRLHISTPAANAIRIEVANTGAWREPSPGPGPHGNGLANLRRRLALLYPGRHRIETTSSGGWVRIVVDLAMQPSVPSR
jgi:two-component system, LytTR family, sensor kinase